MKQFGVEVIVGIFIIIGLACLAFISLNLGKINMIGIDNTYQVKAIFTTVTGLQEDTDVEIAGVRVGKVNEIKLENYEAVVTLELRGNIILQEDAIASIKTKGLLGDSYVEITPGGSDQIIPPGGRIRETEPPIDLKKLIGDFAFGKVE